MIFYFTGTGNSQAAAQMLQQEGEKLIAIGTSVKGKKYDYELAEGEALGFVFPVYFSGVPNIVEWFVRKLRLSGADPVFTYAVMTCGGAPAGADGMMEDLLKKKGIVLDRAYKLPMPENYFIMFPIPSEEEQDKILAAAEETMEEIKADILLGMNGMEEKGIAYRSSKAVRLASRAVYAMYRKGRKTDKFWVDDQCVSCHACENRCPCGAIRLIDGVPTWVKDQCVMCLGCARCGAIHYGNTDEKHGRYKHPIFRKKASHGDHAGHDGCQTAENHGDHTSHECCQ